MSAKKEIKFITDALKEILSDIHILQTHEKLNMDTKCQADIVTAILVAEQSIEKSPKDNDKRLSILENKYDPDTRSAINKSISKINK